MATSEPTARSLDALLPVRAVVATFHVGQTAAGHRWSVYDDAGHELLRTRRVHSGGAVKRALWKSVTLTGLDAGNDVHAELVGAGRAVLARASSVNGKPPTVTVAGPGGASLGLLRREGAALTLELDGRTVATVDAEGDGPWPVAAAGGEQLGELLAGVPARSTSPTWTELLLPYAPTTGADFARTMHLGIRRVAQYSLLRSGPGGEPFDPAHAPPLPRLVGLLPLLAGLVY